MANVDHKISIDLGLAVLCCVNRSGQMLTQQEIAEVCDCSRARIYEIEHRALKKLEILIQRHLYMYDFLRPDIDLPVEQRH